MSTPAPRRLPALSRPGLRLRAVDAADADAIWRWRDPSSAFDRRLAACLADPGARIWIVDVLGEPLGVVAIVPAGAGPGRVAISIEPASRGVGLGRTALACACDVDGGALIAEVAADCRASRACFESCGFRTAGRTSAGGRAVLLYERRPASPVRSLP